MERVSATAQIALPDVNLVYRDGVDQQRTFARKVLVILYPDRVSSTSNYLFRDKFEMFEKIKISCLIFFTEDNINR